MVDELFGTQGAGQDETVFKFASDVNADQTTEIARMEKMLASPPIPVRRPVIRSTAFVTVLALTAACCRRARLLRRRRRAPRPRHHLGDAAPRPIRASASRPA